VCWQRADRTSLAEGKGFKDRGEFEFSSVGPQPTMKSLKKILMKVISGPSYGQITHVWRGGSRGATGRTRTTQYCFLTCEGGGSGTLCCGGWRTFFVTSLV